MRSHLRRALMCTNQCTCVYKVAESRPRNEGVRVSACACYPRGPPASGLHGEA